MSAKKITRCALLTVLAVMLSIIENSLPPLLSFAPGVKIGLSNLVTLLGLILLSYGEAFWILVVRCILSSLISGNVISLSYSLTAGVVSLAVQTVLYHFFIKRISVVTISVIGAVTFNAVQLLVASLYVNVNLISVLPITLIASVIAGLFVGLTAYVTIKYLPQKFYIDNIINKQE